MPADSEMQRAGLAVPASVVGFEQLVLRGLVPAFEQLVTRGLVAVFEQLVTRGLVAVFGRRVLPPCGPVMVALCAPPVVPGSPVARSAPRRGLRGLARELVSLLPVAALRERAPPDWVAFALAHPDDRQPAFEDGPAELARLAGAHSPVGGFAHPVQPTDAGLEPYTPSAAGELLPAFADGRDSRRQIAHGW